jgi:spore germination cell wall hydrolase CwlJ-like protein
MLEIIRAAALSVSAVIVSASASPATASNVIHQSIIPRATKGSASTVKSFAARPIQLSALVNASSGVGPANADQECIASAVYFEARGEPLEGQLAVAEVVLNRAASGKFPSSICAVVKQASQFSFVRKGRIPRIEKASESWRKATAIAHVATMRLAKRLGSDVLWYHANYVRPGWGRALTRVAQIGSHIFYSANSNATTELARL